MVEAQWTFVVSYTELFPPRTAVVICIVYELVEFTVMSILNEKLHYLYKEPLWTKSKLFTYMNYLCFLLKKFFIQNVLHPVPKKLNEKIVFYSHQTHSTFFFFKSFNHPTSQKINVFQIINKVWKQGPRWKQGTPSILIALCIYN